jgi:transcriptional regulator with XRE-family HTH domain
MKEKERYEFSTKLSFERLSRVSHELHHWHARARKAERFIGAEMELQILGKGQDSNSMAGAVPRYSFSSMIEQGLKCRQCVEFEEQKMQCRSAEIRALKLSQKLSQLELARGSSLESGVITAVEISDPDEKLEKRCKAMESSFQAWVRSELPRLLALARSSLDGPKDELINSVQNEPSLISNQLEDEEAHKSAKHSSAAPDRYESMLLSSFHLWSEALTASKAHEMSRDVKLRSLQAAHQACKRRIWNLEGALVKWESDIQRSEELIHHLNLNVQNRTHITPAIDAKSLSHSQIESIKIEVSFNAILIYAMS